MNCALTVIAASCLLLALPGAAGAAIFSQGEGRVNMQGAIIDTACAIATESREQIIDMDIAPVGEIARDGQSKTHAFTIELINCMLTRPLPGLANWQQFQVTFDGDADGDLFGVGGEAKGIALKIADTQGNMARPGKPLPAAEITPGRMILNYTIALVSNNQPLHAGNYSSAVRFKLDYY